MGRLHQENGGLIGADAPRGLAGAGLNLSTLQFYLAGTSFNDTAPAGANLAPTSVGSGITLSTESAYPGGRSIFFPGTSGTTYIAYPHNQSIDLGGGDWTAACWIKWDGTINRHNAIFSKRQSGSEYQGSLNNGNGRIHYFNNTIYDTAVVPPANTWVHLAYQFKNGTGLRVYLNGAQIASFNVTSTASGTNPLIIGGVIGQTEQFGGYIQDLALWRSLPWNYDAFTPPSQPMLDLIGSAGRALGGVSQLGNTVL